MKTVYITSFKKIHRLPFKMPVFSVAVYQPKGLTYPTVDCLSILRQDGSWIKPSEFQNLNNPALAYHDYLLRHYMNQYDDIKAWLRLITDHTAICCWCPYSRPARAQLETWGSFICHTSVVGEVLSKFGISVWYDEDRLKMTVLTQKNMRRHPIKNLHSSQPKIGIGNE